MTRYNKAIAAAVTGALGVAVALGATDEATAAVLRDNILGIVASIGVIVGAVWGVPNAD